MRPQRPRIAWRALHGVLLLDKPRGLSSNDALQRARRLLRAEKGGHTGTLDPLASGLLPLCFGAATKFAQAGLDHDKGYRATLQLGTVTTTGDAEGEPVSVRPVPPLDATALQSACDALVGTIDQVPPMHSALKVDGRALYDYAREGVTVDRAARRVTIHALTVVDGPQALVAGADPAAGRWVVDVRCSKGTYVRTLAEDLGERLGCGAHLAALVRTASGPLRLADAIGLDALGTLDDDARLERLLPPDALVTDWPMHRLDAADAARFLTGLRRRVPGATDHEAVRVFGPEPGAFLGSARIAGGDLIPQRLLSVDEARSVLAGVTHRGSTDVLAA